MDLLKVPKNTKEKIIGVYKYSSCNVNSLVNALEMISVNYKVSSNFSEISNCYKIILPGVGNMKNISKENMEKIPSVTITSWNNAIIAPMLNCHSNLTQI